MDSSDLPWVRLGTLIGIDEMLYIKFNCLLKLFITSQAKKVRL